MFFRKKKKLVLGKFVPLEGILFMAPCKVCGNRETVHSLWTWITLSPKREPLPRTADITCRECGLKICFEETGRYFDRDVSDVQQFIYQKLHEQ